MFRVQHFLMALSLAIFPLGCAPAGCSGEDPEQDKPAAEQFEGAVEMALVAPAPNAPSIYGTWDGDPLAGHFNKLVLMTDGRFHSEETVTCVKAPCPPIMKNGTFKLYAREARTYLELRALEDKLPARFEYAASAQTMRIRPLVAGSEWYALKNAAIAWCGNERDCTVQALPTGPCAGSYACGQNACAWKCAGTGGETEAAKAGDPGTANAVAPGTPGSPTPTDAQLCPKEAECVMANSTCTSNPRDPAACATVTSCKKCFPNGWDVKNIPQTADPNTNPVLKK